VLPEHVFDEQYDTHDGHYRRWHIKHGIKFELQEVVLHLDKHKKEKDEHYSVPEMFVIVWDEENDASSSFQENRLGYDERV